MAANILTLGSTSKMISSPNPLGGYNGFELGLSYETIPMDELARLGSKSLSTGELSYYRLVMGKGLYYDIDFFVQFVPLPQDGQLSGYGFLGRWAIMKGKNFPGSLSLVFSSGAMNFFNLVNTFHQGLDLIANVNVDNISMYIGAGAVKGRAGFIGGAQGVTDDQKDAEVSVEESHALFGINVDFEKTFIALQMDRYQSSSISVKWGLHF